MLLSDQETAKFIATEFVAAWHEVRPVPKVTIDFGNGKTLRRTLAGNTVMYLCLPDGTVVDAYPGVYTPKDFGSVVAKGLAAAKNAMALPASQQPAFIARWHDSMLRQAVAEEQRFISRAKAMVESPLLDAMRVSAPPPVPTSLAKAAVEAPILRSAGLEHKEALEARLDRYASKLKDLSKAPASTEELRVRMGIDRRLPPDEAVEQIVAMDSATNARYVRPAVHMMLSTSGGTPDSLTPALYKRLLHLDISHPYLGLNDLVPPGTPKT